MACDCLVQFSVPDGSSGCQLEFDFPFGFTGSSAGPLDFWTADGNIVPGSCWNDAPSLGNLIGTVTLQHNVSKLVVNSCICQTVMNFRVCMASGAGSGNVSFTQLHSEGLFMRHDC